MTAGRDAVRLFIALDLPPAAKGSLGATAAQLKAAIPSGVRWVDPAGIHLTLKFLGDTDAGLVEPILAAMQPGAGASGGGGFPLAAFRAGRVTQLPETPDAVGRRGRRPGRPGPVAAAGGRGPGPIRLPPGTPTLPPAPDPGTSSTQRIHHRPAENRGNISNPICHTGIQSPGTRTRLASHRDAPHPKPNDAPGRNLYLPGRGPAGLTQPSQ